MFKIAPNTGKSLLEAPILASTNPQYDKRLCIDLQVQYMKITSSEHVVHIRIWRDTFGRGFSNFWDNLFKFGTEVKNFHKNQLTLMSGLK